MSNLLKTVTVRYFAGKCRIAFCYFLKSNRMMLFPVRKKLFTDENKKNFVLLRVLCG
jgi:hypothetical protein